MTLLEEVRLARKKVVTDGYEMSIGELINLYKDKELIIDPVFQRLFRWDDERKSRFIESILLGIPIPSIFVHQTENGAWELVDGLQRISTILQLTGDLKTVQDGDMKPLVLSGTKLLPDLDGKQWKPSTAKGVDLLDISLQLDIKRSRIRVEIIKADSDKTAKFELFQRLNTGGVGLTEQEVRNSIAVSINKDFYDWLEACSVYPSFVRTTKQTENAVRAQSAMELVLRFFAFRNVEYIKKLDVHEYLDGALIKMSSDAEFDTVKNGEIFQKTFDFLDGALGQNSFKKWNGTKFSGMFLMSAFEVIATGVAANLRRLGAMSIEKRNESLTDSVKKLWKDEHFNKYSGAGVRGTTRLANLLPVAQRMMKP